MVPAFGTSLYGACFHGACFHGAVSRFLNFFCPTTPVLRQRLSYHLLCFTTPFVLRQHLSYDCPAIFHPSSCDLPHPLTFLVLGSPSSCDSICPTILLVLRLPSSYDLSFLLLRACWDAASPSTGCASRLCFAAALAAEEVLSILRNAG